MKIDKKKWFPVLDSLTQDDDGNEFYNVEAKFADHPVLNVEKSRVARHNVYDLSIVLHTKVLIQGSGDPAVKNSSSHVMRFDKGEDTRVKSYRPGPEGKEVIHYDGKTGMGKEAFDAAVRDIMRCWNAWEHYQLFRQAPVHPLEEKALDLIASKPKLKNVMMIDVGGVLVPVHRDDEGDDDDDDPSEPENIKKPVIAKAKASGKRARAA